MVIDPATTKYMIKATIRADGVIEKSDVVGAIFGQTEGLLGDELDLRELQRSARVGRIEVELESKNGKSQGTITLPTSLDKVETVILAAAFESIDRVGPCKATIEAEEVEDVRVARRKQVIERAKVLLNKVLEEGKVEGGSIADNVRQAVQIEEIINYGPERCPAGPNIEKSDAIIVVEGRRDVLNLLRYGIKNVIAVGGTNLPKTVADLTTERITTAFVDGDRGGELILKELLQTADIDFVSRAPQTREVEEIPQKLVMKALKNKIPAEQYAEMYNIEMHKDTSNNFDKSKTTGKSGKKESKNNSSKKSSVSKSKPDDYFSILDDVSGSLKAVLLDKKDK
ncbi:MAG: DNA primase, partial [Candidatus Thermoplasmatota archaeon]|nr:DNA primase [Candidatus Thermoplasmatota archaeon]